MMNNETIKRNPAIVYSLIMGLVVSVLVFVTVFNFIQFTLEQHAAILALVSALIVLATYIITGVVVRSQVTPNASVVERLDHQSGNVIAGEANERVETGEKIRDLGAPYVPERAYPEDLTRPEEGTINEL